LGLTFWVKGVYRLVVMKMATTINTATFLKSLKADRKQVPYATSLAVNNTMKAVAIRATSTMRHYVDRPTPFTMRAFMTPSGGFKGRYASKRRLFATLIAGKIQNDYLKYVVEGGVQSFPKKHPAPGKTYPLNQYGNLPRRATKQKKAFHIKTKSGKTQSYRRVGKGIQLIATFNKQGRYKKTFPLYSVCKKTAQRRFPMEFRKAMARAMRTATKG